jgi:hypothetical protein
MYRIVFPIAAISGEGGGILDNSSNLAKEDLFFSFVDFWRQKICRSTRPKGQFVLNINGYGKQGYKYALIPAPVAPRNIIIEEKIMATAIQQGRITTSEYRGWLNSTVLGFRPEDDFENKLGLVKPAEMPASANNQAIQNVLNGKKEISDVVAEKVQETTKL